MTTKPKKPTVFAGTSNPRQLRVIAALMRRPQPRKQIDGVAGCSNGPALIADLQGKGLDIPCERIHAIDRDGRLCKPGVYSFTLTDRRKIFKWMAMRE